MTHFQRYLMTRFNGNQRELAQALDISQPYTSLLLSGKKRPSLALAVRIERATGGLVPVHSWVETETETEAGTNTSQHEKKEA